MPKQIPMSEKREWLKEHDDGKPAAVIAREYRRALKVVKKGVEEARAERDGAAARAEIVKEALINHQKQLMAIIGRLIAATEMPPADLQLRHEANGALAPLALAGKRIFYTPSQGITVELPDENTAQWGLLREHLARDRIWSAIRDLKEATAAYFVAFAQLELEIQSLIESETGYEVQESRPLDTTRGFVYPLTAELFQTVNMRRAFGIPDGTDLEKRMVATEDGYIHHGKGGSALAYCPGRQNQCQKALIKAFAKVPDSAGMKRMLAAEDELKKVSAKLRRLLEDIQLMGLVGGRCRICSRISL